MSKSISSILLVAGVLAVSACTTRTTTIASGDAMSTAQSAAEEFVIVEPTPISNEPVFTGKYK